MNNEKNKQFSIKFKPSLMEKVEYYIKLVNSTKTDKEPKLTKATFFNTVVAEYFEHTVITNDFITLDIPLYFNSKELVEEGSVKCSFNKPTDLDNVMIVKRVPNNLDRLVKTYNHISYYYESHYRHKGIVFSAIQLTEEKSLEPKYLVFDYNSFGRDDTELIISILKPEDLTTYLDIEEDKDLILELKETVDSFEVDLEEAINFYIDNDEIFKNKDSFEDVPEDLITGFSKVGYNVVKYYCFNFDSFVPIRIYSKLQQLIIYLNKSSTEELVELEKALGITKEELEAYVETFVIEDSYKFMMFFLKVILHEPNLDFEKLANDFLQEENISNMINNYFINELE